MLKGLTDFKILNNYSRYIAQAPQPIVKIFEFYPEFDTENPILEFNKGEIKVFTAGEYFFYKEENVLQGYSFKFSTSDTDGNFTLTLHPGNSENPYFDKIKPLQIVKIYERDRKGKTPDFVGVINRKKFVAQPGSGLRISIIGKSVASFISRFKISLDLNAMAITHQLASDYAIATKFTTDLAEEFAKKDVKLSEVLQSVWDYAVLCARECLKLSTSDIEKYVNKYLGSDFFDMGDSAILKYPLSNIFNGQNTISFWNIVSDIVPFPVYEKFAFIDKSGKTKIKIREVPFDCSGDGLGFSSWDKLEKDMTELDPAIVKGFDFDVSDDEVYTVFFSYIKGSPLSSDMALRLFAQTDGLSASTVDISAKAKVYGYSPLTVTFNGYSSKETKKEQDNRKKTTNEYMKELNQRLENWYGHLEEMLKGTITLSTIMAEQMPMCGEIVSFLGGEFYVNEVEHTWNFGGNPETKLTVSRGGNYEKKKFAPLEGITKRYVLFKQLLDTAKAKGINIL